MVGNLADSATLGGAVDLSTSGTRATSDSRLRKSNNKLSGSIQTMMAYGEFDEATVGYILCIFHCIQMHIYYVFSFHFRVKSPAKILEHAQDYYDSYHIDFANPVLRLSFWRSR